MSKVRVVNRKKRESTPDKIVGYRLVGYYRSQTSASNNQERVYNLKTRAGVVGAIMTACALFDSFALYGIREHTVCGKSMTYEEFVAWTPASDARKGRLELESVDDS